MFRGTRRDLFVKTEYELDTDDLDGNAISQLEAEQQQQQQQQSGSSSRSHRRSEQSMPLLVGLLDSAAARRGPDGTLQIQMNGYESEDDVDLDALAAKTTSGGSIFDSIANMANSILGAGMYVQHHFPACSY